MAELIILDNKDQSLPQTKWNKNQGIIYKLNNILLSYQKINIRDKSIFFRLTAVMLDSWMTLVKSIWTLEKQEKNKLTKKMLADFVFNLKSWKTLSECMELYPVNFSESEIWMVKSWEKTWKLNETLISVADQVEKISSIVTKLRSAMIYPAMILIVVIMVIVIMMVYIVPKLLEIFEDKSALPASTRLLISISDFMVNYGIFIIFLLVVSFVFFLIWKQTETWRLILDKFKLVIPKFWDIYKKYLLSKFARVFSNLIASWVSVVESLKIVANSLNNEIYRQRILLLAEDVKSWIKIWESIDRDPLFPDMMVQMIQVWEQTATIDKTIVKVADFFDEQFDATISAINKLIEPIIIVFLATTVWFIAISIMQPIMWLADQISNT